MRVRLLTGLLHDGREYEKGSTVELPAAVAARLILIESAEALTEPAAPLVPVQVDAVQTMDRKARVGKRRSA